MKRRRLADLAWLWRALFAVAILGATLLWANCDLIFTLQDPPETNKQFAGCFEGTTADPAGKVRIVLEVNPSGTRLALTGCIEVNVSVADLASISGVVEDEPELALMTAVRPDQTTYMFRVTRQPAGQVPASTIDLANFDGAPFTTATALTRCVPEVTCADLGISQPFLPGGGSP